jgi:gliotoxin/aspirochlorine/mycotoxins biosynthesis cytochrome P450 monooxygenase
VTRSKHIKAIFHDSNHHLKAKNNNSGWLMGEVLGRCVGLLSQGDWSLLRSRVEVPFLHKNVLEFLPIIQTKTTAFFSELLERKTTAIPIEETNKGVVVAIDAARDTRMLPFRLVATLLYGELPLELILELEKLIPNRELLFTYVIKGGVSRFWWSAYLPTQANKLLNQFQNAWLAFNRNAYQSAKERGLSVPIVELWDQMESGQLDRRQVRATVIA